MTFPSASRMGVFARMDGPSEPFWIPTNVFPERTACGFSPGSSSSDVPIICGLGCEKRIPWSSATTMNAAPAASRKCSAIGSMIAGGSGRGERLDDVGVRGHDPGHGERPLAGVLVELAACLEERHHGADPDRHQDQPEHQHGDLGRQPARQPDPWDGHTQQGNPRHNAVVCTLCTEMNANGAMLLAAENRQSAMGVVTVAATQSILDSAPETADISPGRQRGSDHGQETSEPPPGGR